MLSPQRFVDRPLPAHPSDRLSLTQVSFRSLPPRGASPASSAVGIASCDFCLQVCPICALGAHLLFCRIAIAAGEPRARPKRLQRVTRPSARARRRDPRRHATGAGVLPPNPHTSFARSDSPCPLAASLRSRGADGSQVALGRSERHASWPRARRAHEQPLGRRTARRSAHCAVACSAR